MKYLPELAFALYLMVDAIQDARYIRKYGKIYHVWNWILRALAAAGIGLARYQDFWYAFVYCLTLVPMAWIIFDFVVYSALNKNPFTYIGSGNWDEIFKHYFGNKGKNPERAVMAIWISKLILLFFALSIYFGYLP